MIGVLATVLLQSSSTATSVVVTMVSSGSEYNHRNLCGHPCRLIPVRFHAVISGHLTLPVNAYNDFADHI